MSVKDAIPLEGISVSQLRLKGEDVLVRPRPMEDRTASGLYVPNTPSQNFLGDVFVGEVVATGPGRCVEAGPTPEEVGDFIREAASKLGAFAEHGLRKLADQVEEFVRRKTAERFVPPPASVGEHVYCRQGFGPEVSLREGLHQIVGRGNAQFGHGVIASWDAEHRHCWHYHRDEAVVRCSCGEERERIETRLPACSSCPPGDRLAEAVLGGKVAEHPFGKGDGPGAYELRPEDDGRDGV